MSIVVRVDRRGRLVIPKELREKFGIRDYVEISVEGNKIIIRPIKSIADKFFGVFKVERWPEDLDEFLAKEVTKGWLRDT